MDDVKRLLEDRKALYWRRTELHNLEVAGHSSEATTNEVLEVLSSLEAIHDELWHHLVRDANSEREEAADFAAGVMVAEDLGRALRADVPSAVLLRALDREYPETMPRTHLITLKVHWYEKAIMDYVATSYGVSRSEAIRNSLAAQWAEIKGGEADLDRAWKEFLATRQASDEK